MAAPSFDDLYLLGKAEGLARRPDVFFAPGDITDFLLCAAAAMADKCIQDNASNLRRTFLDGAVKAELTELCDDHWSVQRVEPTKASIDLTFTRGVAGAAGAIPVGFKISSEPDENGDRQEFTVVTQVSWALNETGAKTTTGIAVVAGRAGNVAVGSVTNCVDSPFDANVTVANTSVGAGGNEEEGDVRLRERTRRYPSTLRRGTVDAIEYGAQQVPQCRVATVVEDIGGLVTVFVTDEFGNSTQQMVSDVEGELEEWRCAGVTLTVTGGTLSEQDVTYQLVCKVGTDPAQLQAAVDAAITARMAKLPAGDGESDSPGVLYRHVIQAAILGVDDNILAALVTTPAADVVPEAGEVIRAGTITRTES